MVADPKLREAFGHALVLIFFYAVVPLAIGLLLAALLNRGKVRGLPFFRTVIFLPQVIAMVVVAVAWRQIYAPNGDLNTALRALGLDSLARPWLGDYTFSLIAVGFIGTWVCMGLVTILLLAGMTKVPIEQYEAARLDGAGAVREFFAVTLPSIRGEITVALTLTIIAALKTFDLVYVTTNGGPGTSTSVPSFEVYRRAFQMGEVGHGRRGRHHPDGADLRDQPRRQQSGRQSSMKISRVERLSNYVILIAFAAFALWPIFTILVTSLGPKSASVAREGRAIHWENYIEAWTQGRFSQYLVTSVTVSVLVVSRGARVLAHGRLRVRHHEVPR